MGKGLSDAMDILDEFRDAATGGQGLKGRAARAVCDAYAGNPTAGAMIATSNRGFGLGMQYGCGPYWEGPDGYPPPTENTPPFEGGQCEGVAYMWESQRLNNSTCQLEPTQNSTPRVGPITRVSSSAGNLLTIDGCQGRSYTDVFEADGATFAVQRRGLPDSAPAVRWVRVDGLPDECGDPEPVGGPFLPGSPPPGRGFGDPRDIGEPGEPYVITPRPPVIGPDGQPTMPVDTPTGPVDFRPDGDEPGPGGEPSIGEPIDVGGGSGEVDEDPDDALTKPTLLGYRYTVKDDAPQFQSVIPGTNPRIYSRVVGSIQLILRGENGTFYSDNLQITSEEGSIVKSHPTLRVVGCVYNVLPNLGGLTLREIRGKDDDS